MCPSRPRPSLQAFFSNWKQNRLPFFAKIGMALKNNLIKLKTRQNCCGHYGEIGC